MNCVGLIEGREEDAIDVAEMRVAEVNSAWWGVPVDSLMEAAGKSVADAVRCLVGELSGVKVAVVAGKGGNGGDGLAAARYLSSMGANVTVHSVYPIDAISHPSSRRQAMYIARSRRIKLLQPGRPGWLSLKEAEIVVDAILGVGIRGALRDPIGRAIEEINSNESARLSIDVPSGVDPDSGDVSDVAVEADYTISLHKPKKGLFTPTGRKYSGKILVASIGIPVESLLYAGPGDVGFRVPSRPREAHKGVGGRVLVVGGSREYVGAPILAALAAARAGADLVYLSAPSDYARHASVRYPVLIPVPREEGDPVRSIRNVIWRVHAVVVGPGISEEEGREITDFLEEEWHGKPLVVDATGLRVITDKTLWPEAVMTPHRGEASFLAGQDYPTLADYAKGISKAFNSTVAIKAPQDVVCLYDSCRLNLTGSPGMATGGTGDVLSGIIAAFLARRVALGLRPDPLNTTAAALYVCGRAGEMAVSSMGEDITATDLLNYVPQAIKESREFSSNPSIKERG